MTGRSTAQVKIQMRSKLPRASAIAVAATVFATIFATGDSGAVAQDHAPEAVTPMVTTQFVSEPVLQELPAEAEDAVISTDSPITTAHASTASLAELVAAQPQPGKLSRELHCLAGAVFFEARGETLAGQLAVGRVIVARSRSGRFPDSYCGVVFQRSQFSFVRGASMPTINTNSASWKNAVAIAQIAHSGGWESKAEGALFFHATHVRPAWRLTRVARVDNHVFYR